MLIGIWLPLIAAAGGIWIVATMCTALVLRLKVKGSIRSVIPDAAIGISAVTVALSHSCL